MLDLGDLRDTVAPGGLGQRRAGQTGGKANLTELVGQMLARLRALDDDGDGTTRVDGLRCRSRAGTPRGGSLVPHTASRS
jgi:hypothetical protein